MAILHCDGNIAKEILTKCKLDMKTFYNKVKGRVDVADELCNCAITQNTKNCPKAVLLDPKCVWQK